MKKTILSIVMAALCLNFSYGQEKKNNSSINKPYKFAFSGFKSGYPSGYRISNDGFMKGKSITVRNYTVVQLFALALGAGNKTTPVIPAEKIIIDVRTPDKLKQLRCYQLLVPNNLTDSFYIIMQQNICEEFPDYVVKMETLENGCFMVIRDREY